MAKKRSKTTPASIARRKKAGRGEGEGENYKPYNHIQDFSSKGRKTRVWGYKTKRIHHYLSDLELAYHFMLQMSSLVTDFHEQYDLNLNKTIELSKRLDIDHPTDTRTGVKPPMTTDFHIVLSDGKSEKIYIRTLKYAKELNDMRVLEKFEIERVYFEGLGVDWGIVTEREIPEQLKRNVADLQSYTDISMHNINEEQIDQIITFLSPLVYKSKTTFQELARLCEEEFEFPAGLGVTIIKHLLLNSTWQVDLNSPIKPNKPLTLLLNCEYIDEVKAK